MKIIKKILFRCISIVFIMTICSYACSMEEPHIGWRVIIKNNTKDTIYFEFAKKHYSYLDGNRNNITCYPKLDAFYEYNLILYTADCSYPLDDVIENPLVVRTSNDKKLIKSFVDFNNWTCEKTYNALKFTFEINEEDLE